MNKRYIRLILLVAMLSMLAFLPAMAQGESSNPIETNIEISPSTLTSTGVVRVNISISNVMDDSQTVSVTLYDPSGNVVSKFGSGGTANIAPGSAMAYSGSWTVSQSQLDSGKIQYSVRYKFYNGAGEQVSGSKPVSGRITYQTAKPSVEIERILPASSITEGQTASITYIFSNTGTVDVQNITVSDPGISSEKLVCESLPVGESTELTHTFVMGDSALTSEAVLSYEYQQGSETKTSSATCKAMTFEVAKVDVLVQLAANTMIVNPGDKVDLTCVITNKGDLSYSKMKITDPTLGDLDSGIAIEAGKSRTFTKSITVSESCTYTFTVSGVDSFGAPVSFTSNDITVQTTKAADDVDTSPSMPPEEIIPLDLSVIIEADREVIYEMPSDVIFTIKISNNGMSEARDLKLKTTGYFGVDVDTIESLAAGASMTIQRQFQASMGGQYQFAVSGKNNGGEEQTFESNVYRIVYQSLATPTPSPTPSPTPTARPVETPTPTATINTPFGEDEEGGGGIGSILLYILLAILAVMVIAVILLIVLDRRRGGSPRGGSPVVYDSLQRGTHRDYARAPKRGPAPKSGNQARRSAGESAATEGGEAAEAIGGAAAAAAAAAVTVEEEDERISPYAPPAHQRRVQIHDVEPDDQPTVRYDANFVNQVRQSEAAAEAIEVPEETAIFQKVNVQEEPEAEEVPAAEIPQERGVPMSEEDAAMLSGSTGEYRLSRRKQAPRATETSSRPEPMDPDAFSKMQRASRSRNRNFFEDVEDADNK